MPGMERDERSACEEPPDHNRQVNRTYVVSELSNGKLTLQRRSRRNTGTESAEKLTAENSQNTTPAPEKRLTLQRRMRTNSACKDTPDSQGILSEINGRTPSSFNLVSERKITWQPKGAGTIAPSSTGSPVIGQASVFKTPGKQTQVEPVSQQFHENPPRAAVLSRPSHDQDSFQLVHTDSISMDSAAITVAVRVRPFNTREKNTQPAIDITDQETIIRNPETKQSFSFNFDFAFSSTDEADPAFASQQTVYEKIARPLLQKALEGFNVCIFAYGHTGSGKSYTIMGTEESPGIIPRFCQELFSKLTVMEDEGVKSVLELSYSEIYNEKIYDLLSTSADPKSNNNRKIPLKVRTHPKHGTYVAELSTNLVKSESDILGWLALGNKWKATASTFMNEKSSRSHSILTLVLKQTKTEFVEGQHHSHCVTSRIHLVDLAGSEQLRASQDGDRFQECRNINRSLLTFGKVITALSLKSQDKAAFIPYRDSLLTWLLKDSLGGNSQTALIATVSPAVSCFTGTLSTLRFAQKTSKVINKVNINQDDSSKLISELKAEIGKLRNMLRNPHTDMHQVSRLEKEVLRLKRKLLERDHEISEANRAQEEKHQRAEARKRRETLVLQTVGVTFERDNTFPCLVNLNEDAQLSETLVYAIKNGKNTVGNMCQDIQLSGGLVADHHCVLYNLTDKVSIIPCENAKTYINGNNITESTLLHNGDRIILGGSHYFRFHHPREMESSSSLHDFEFARNELLAALNPALQEGIEEANMNAKKEMLKGIEAAQELAQKETAHGTEALKSQSAQGATKHMVPSKIIAALEEEKNKLSQVLEEQAQKMLSKEKLQRVPDWQMKLHLMIEEANTICKRRNNNLVFSRYEVGDSSSTQSTETMIRIRHTVQGVATLCSVDTFIEKMIALRELEQEGAASKDEFYDPFDEWEHDLSAPSPGLSNLSQPRKRKLVERFYEKQVRRLSQTASQSAGAAAPVTTASPVNSLPAVCMDLIRQSIFRLSDCSTAAKTMADKLVTDLQSIFSAAQTLTKQYNNLDRDNTDSAFGSEEAQRALVTGTAALDSAGFSWMQWLGSIEPSSGTTYLFAEKLKHQIKIMGDYLLMAIKGCESDVRMFVTQVDHEIGAGLQAALMTVGQLVALLNTPLDTMVPGTQAIGQGILKGVHGLFRETFTACTDMLSKVLESSPKNIIQQRIKLQATDAAHNMQKYFNHIIEELELLDEEHVSFRTDDLKTLSSIAFKLRQGVRRLHASISCSIAGIRKICLLAYQ
ncbi:kinesin-like protein KIF14 [Salarias fasciatus]|uniref:kinesin-like protein KIF14 n=1 Tax=Salarias fasciatus TaxID=181472 RepID=UPI0011768876|nr:kinesin-like protein KIF14 [Salarias fasciatus]